MESLETLIKRSKWVNYQSPLALLFREPLCVWFAELVLWGCEDFSSFSPRYFIFKYSSLRSVRGTVETAHISHAPADIIKKNTHKQTNNRGEKTISLCHSDHHIDHVFCWIRCDFTFSVICIYLFCAWPQSGELLSGMENEWSPRGFIHCVAQLWLKQKNPRVFV